ncbi:hypothetical protein AVEN_19376-1 [Araneus ventricosus]|uniref:Uncharacterized protein n=1 Tax=Araneus ventricosus TaxID=182803 RepID=A0A4Y2UP98_ARAVE|nr:hypothetical protein AVEN_19376-1 [Araneus ventricosus]
MAAVRIALCLYYDKDIEKILEGEKKLPYSNGEFSRKVYKFWKRIEMKAAEKVSSLPTSLQTRVVKFIRPIDLETIKWTSDHANLLKLGSTYTYKSILRWKTVGTIDRTQTAMKFSQNKNFDPETRFNMACTYFLEDEVLALWHGDEVLDRKRLSRNGRNAAVRFWVKRLKEGSCRKRPWKDMIDGYFQILSVRRSDIRLRVSCFFPYLSWEGKKNYVRNLLCSNIARAYSDDLRLCMHAMDEAERVELFSEYHVHWLYYCLEWPFQSLFIDLANQLWSHINADKFHAVLFHIIRFSILRGLECFDYVGLLKEFWHDSPDAFKENIMKRKKSFKVITEILNYDEKNASLPLPETLSEFMPKYWH